jgi:hypothetical protein
MIIIRAISTPRVFGFIALSPPAFQKRKAISFASLVSLIKDIKALLLTSAAKTSIWVHDEAYFLAGIVSSGRGVPVGGLTTASRGGGCVLILIAPVGVISTA